MVGLPWPVAMEWPAAHSFPTPAGWGEKLEKQNWEKLMCQDKNRLIMKEREKQTNKQENDAKVINHHLLPDWWPDSLWVMATLEQLSPDEVSKSVQFL